MRANRVAAGLQGGFVRDGRLQNSGIYIEIRVYGLKRCANHRHDRHSAAQKSDPHARNGAQARPVIPSRASAILSKPYLVSSYPRGHPKWESFLQLWTFLVGNYMWTQCEVSRD